jgi:protein phosphatase 1 regulatory subunit 7
MNTKLTKLNLDENKIHFIDFEQLSQLYSLRNLWLNENSISDVSNILVSLPRLEELYIAKNKITSVRIIERHYSLQVMNISANFISSLREI